jgi:hypothetical protein
VEAVNLNLTDELVGERANGWATARVPASCWIRLTGGLSGRASKRGFAKAIRSYLEGRHGRPQLKSEPARRRRGQPVTVRLTPRHRDRRCARDAIADSNELQARTGRGRLAG